MRWLDEIPFYILIFGCLTLGLAPFVPEPHLWEKLRMLQAGQLHRPLDIFDLFMHGAPWVLLAVRSGRWVGRRWGRNPLP